MKPAMMLYTLFLVLNIYFLTVHGTITDVPIQPPNIIYPNSTMTVYKQGKSFSLFCMATGTPQPTYHWTKDDFKISSDGHVSFDAVMGILMLNDFSVRNEGRYRCHASNYFDGLKGRTTATSLSPQLTVKYTRLDSNNSNEQINITGKEYDYIKLHCGSEKFIAVAESIQYNWFFGSQHHQMSMDNGRLYIDKFGDLHIMYLKITDSTSLRCRASTDLSETVVFGDIYHLTVTTNPLAVNFIPQLRYKSEDTKGILHQRAKIECIFTGYGKTQPLPLISWIFEDGTVIQNSSKYIVSADGRSLTINNLLEQDERHYYCKAKNGAGETIPHAVFLNVTSPPIFLENKSPRDITVSQGKDVTIPCEARSALNEGVPSPVTWFINGVPTDTNIDRSKFSIQSGSMTIKSVRKPDDIMCVQCMVTNSEGELNGEACVNVLLPITVTRQPPLEQEISKGDTIDLTVRAISDISMIPKYSWTHYRDNDSTEGDIPKFTFYDHLTDEAYINTHGMPDVDYVSVGGTYRLNISHAYDYRIVEIHVGLKPSSDSHDSSCDPCSGVTGLPHHSWLLIMTIILLVTRLST